MKHLQTAALLGVCAAGLYFSTSQNIFASFGALMIAACAGCIAAKDQIIRRM
jgi:hypothetical protein